jgi:hypothetical protein
MKTFLLSILSLAVVAGPALGAQDDDQTKQPKKQVTRAPQHVNIVPRTIQQPRVQRTVPPVTRQTYAPKVYTPNKVQTRTFTPPDRDAPRLPNTVNNWQSNTYNRNNSNVVTAQTPQSTTNTTVRNRDWRNRTTTNNNTTNWQNNRNRNWNNNTSGVFTFEQARRHHRRDRHDRSWWSSRYNRIVLFGGGYYYWDNNYWYPAYGYDPYYSNYTYDEPIYGYNDLAPGQVIANVQTELQRAGYYNDAVDGLIGPNTRAALSNFQRDNGLPITASIDGPTLQALGLN